MEVLYLAQAGLTDPTEPGGIVFVGPSKPWVVIDPIGAAGVDMSDFNAQDTAAAQLALAENLGSRFG